ncbi:hypothetical protein BV25DRAFT_373065 [Artomyces pyxidatus]|uniref:Uncharacterized protein n=1 Tax=Artomyces pyxidatus TaxID=48021 RepID=A0ACB8T711_9AGAM|nr:hypothetical protein BV25DRAFT_373065 [Artomyces pyxidatus]
MKIASPERPPCWCPLQGRQNLTQLVFARKCRSSPYCGAAGVGATTGTILGTPSTFSRSSQCAASPSGVQVLDRIHATGFDLQGLIQHSNLCFVYRHILIVNLKTQQRSDMRTLGRAISYVSRSCEAF